MEQSARRRRIRAVLLALGAAAGCDSGDAPPSALTRDRGEPIEVDDPLH